MRIASAAKAHTGEKLSTKMRIFALPPPEIGDVISVGSNLETGAEPVTAFTRLWRTALLTGAAGWVALIALLIPAAILVWLLMQGFGVEQETARLIAKVLVTIGSLVTAGFAAPIAWQVNGPFPKCSYVGREGLAQFAWGERLPSAVLKFAEARTLRRQIKQGKEDREGKRRRTFLLAWYGGSGLLQKFVIRGEIAEKDPEHAFALAAERAWNAHLLERAQQEVEKRGYVELVRDDKDASKRVRIGRSFMELVDGDRIERWSASDLDSVEVNQGAVIVRRHDPLRGRSSIEKRYPAGEMENESFFPIALREIARMPVEDAGQTLLMVDS